MSVFDKFLVGTLIVLGFLAIGTSVVKAEDIRKEAIYPVYKIQNGARSCSAFVIDSEKLQPTINPNLHLLFTAKHCVSPTQPTGKIIEEYLLGSSEVTKYRNYRVVAVGETTDIAALLVDDPTFDPEEVVIADTQKAQEGDLVYSVGYPLGGSRVVSQGFLGQQELQMHPSMEMKVMQRAATNLDTGMSGGPLFQKTENGYEVIGIASTKYKDNEFMNSFVTLEDIQKFIKEGK